MKENRIQEGTQKSDSYFKVTIVEYESFVKLFLRFINTKIFRCCFILDN